jgi:uncharacterized lipoprotein YbaY
MPPRTLDLTIELPESASLPRGSQLVVELRDTALEDAPAVTLQRLRSTVDETAAGSLHVSLDSGPIPDGTTLWVHLDVDGDGRVSAGDYITMQSYPVADRGPREMTVRLRRV